MLELYAARGEDPSAAYIATIFLFMCVYYCVHQVRKHQDAAAEALSPDEDCVNLVDLPHASNVERKVVLQKALAASTAALESMQATAGFDMMVKREQLSPGTRVRGLVTLKDISRSRLRRFIFFIFFEID